MNKILVIGLGVIVVLAIMGAVVYPKVAGVAHQPLPGAAPNIPTREQFVQGSVQTCVSGHADNAELTKFCTCVGDQLRAHLTDEDMIATKGNSLPPQVQTKINDAESACESGSH